MSYVRFSTKVVHPCEECGDEGWVALLPEYPDFLTWKGVVGDFETFPACCTSCWYIYDDVGGFLAVYHAGPHVCQGPNGEGYDGARLHSIEEAEAWTPPEWCRHRQVALDCVCEWIAEERDTP